MFTLPTKRIGSFIKYWYISYLPNNDEFVCKF